MPFTIAAGTQSDHPCVRIGPRPKRYFGREDVGQWYYVQQGDALIVPRGDGFFRDNGCRLEFPAGTYFRVVRHGNEYQYAITEVTE